MNSQAQACCGGTISAICSKQIGCNHKRWQMKSRDAGVAKTQGLLLKTDAGPLRSPHCCSNTTDRLLKGPPSPIYEPLFFLWEPWSLHPSLQTLLCKRPLPFLLSLSARPQAQCETQSWAPLGYQREAIPMGWACPGEDLVGSRLFQFVPKVRLHTC